jgi:hypothetical protein
MRKQLFRDTHKDRRIRHVIRDLVICDRTSMLSTPRAVAVSAHDDLGIFAFVIEIEIPA